MVDCERRDKIEPLRRAPSKEEPEKAASSWSAGNALVLPLSRALLLPPLRTSRGSGRRGAKRRAGKFYCPKLASGPSYRRQTSQPASQLICTACFVAHLRAMRCSAHKLAVASEQWAQFIRQTGARLVTSVAQFEIEMMMIGIEDWLAQATAHNGYKLHAFERRRRTEETGNFRRSAWGAEAAETRGGANLRRICRRRRWRFRGRGRAQYGLE